MPYSKDDWRKHVPIWLNQLRDIARSGDLAKLAEWAENFAITVNKWLAGDVP